MFDTFLATIMLCAVGVTDLDLEKCVFMEDKLGPVSSRVTCGRRLDMLWKRMMNNPAFISKTHKKIGDFRLIQKMHRGFCLDPQFSPTEEMHKYYDL